MENSLHDPAKDWLLASLNTLVNNKGITIGITIVTHGFMIKGDLACGKDYLEAIKSGFTGILQSGNTEENFIEVGQRIYNSDSDHVKNGAVISDYIHIMNATFLNAEGMPLSSMAGTWWRGRMSQISGYSLGVSGQQ